MLPAFRDNELQNRWVSESSWTFQRSFKASEELLAHTNVDLLIGGLDTVAQVAINGQDSQKSSNDELKFADILHSQNVHRFVAQPVRACCMMQAYCTDLGPV